MKSPRPVVLTTVFALTPVVCLVGFGCHPMDRVAWSIEEYGTVSVSAPLLVPVEKAKGFGFDLDKNAEFYYNVSRVEGAVRLVQQRAFDVQFAMRVQVNELLSSLAELKQARTAAQSEAVQRKLTKQALAIAALQQAAMGSAGADAIAANPLLKVGMDVLASSLGIGPDDQGNVKPDEAPDDAAPPETIEEALTEGISSGSTPNDTTGVTPETDATSKGAGAGADEGGEPAFKSLLPLARPAKDVLTSPQFSAPLGQYAGPISISPRKALMLSANDKMTQDLFNWFARPNGFGANKKAYFCMLTVSCQPGYWTKKNFAADVLITTEYGNSRERMKKNKKKTKTPPAPRKSDTCQDAEQELAETGPAGAGSGDMEPHPDSDETKRRRSSSENASSDSQHPRFSDSFRRPLVAAVYPMVDSQVLDLRHSQREQMASAISLALTGFGAQAELLADAVKRLERDAQTRTAVTVGSAYSAGGYNFGFRIEPRFVAIEDPTKFRGGPGNILEATQFPALVLVFVDKADLAKDVGGTDENGKGYDQIVFHVESRWLPKDWVTGLFYRQSERKMLRRAHRLDEQRAKLSRPCNKDPKRSIFSPNLLSTRRMGDLEYATLKRRRWALAAAGLGSTIEMKLPSTEDLKEPTVPTRLKKEHSGWDNALSTFIVAGNNFSDATVKGAVVGGRACAVKVLGPKALVVACDAWGDKTTSPQKKDQDKDKPLQKMEIATTFGPVCAGQVVFDRHYEMTREKARPSVTLKRDSAGNITGVKVTGEFEDAEKLLKAVEEALKCCGNLDLQIDASGSVGVSAGSGANP